MQTPGYRSREETLVGADAEGRRVPGTSPLPMLHAASRDLKEKMTARGRETGFKRRPKDVILRTF